MDLNYFQNEDLLKCLIQTHNNHKVIVPELQQIYLIPVFVQKNKYIKLSSDDIYFIVRFINASDYILNYFIDPPPDSVANPNGGDRICNFTVSNLFVGRFLRFFILNFYIPFLYKAA